MFVTSSDQFHVQAARIEEVEAVVDDFADEAVVEVKDQEVEVDREMTMSSRHAVVPSSGRLPVQAF